MAAVNPTAAMSRRKSVLDVGADDEKSEVDDVLDDEGATNAADGVKIERMIMIEDFIVSMTC